MHKKRDTFKELIISVKGTQSGLSGLIAIARGNTGEVLFTEAHSCTCLDMTKDEAIHIAVALLGAAGVGCPEEIARKCAFAVPKNGLSA